VATTALKEINADINFIHQEIFVTESTPPDLIPWEEFNSIISVADGWDVRILLDRQAHLYNVPMLDGGSECLTANVKSIIPGVTKSYVDSLSTDTQNAVQVNCTDRVLCNKTEHVVQKAAFSFGNLFHEWKEISNLKIEEWSVENFNHLFNDTINNLLKECKPDDPFWESNMPIPLFYNETNILHKATVKMLEQMIIERQKTKEKISFDKDNELHVNLVTNIAKIYSICYSLSEPSQLQVMKYAGLMQEALVTTGAIASGFLCLNLYYLALKSTSVPNLLYNGEASVFIICQPSKGESLRIFQSKELTQSTTVEELANILDLTLKWKLKKFQVVLAGSIITGEFEKNKHKRVLDLFNNELLQKYQLKFIVLKCINTENQTLDVRCNLTL